jgi:folylpolyglutamate synthase/dihydropteroate synthase
MIMAYVLGTAETNPSAEYWLLKQQVNKDFLNIIQVYLSVLDEIGAKPITHEIAMLREDLKQQTIQITDVAKFVQALNDIAVAIKKAKETQDTYL